MLKTIPLKGNRSLIASYSLAKRRTTRWVVFLQESGAEFQYAGRNDLARLIGARLARDFNFLVVNKPGLGPQGTDHEAFEMSFRRPRRVEDALTAIDKIVGKRDKIYLVGYSEGAYLVPQVAREDSRVRAVTMIGGGTRGWLKEELSNADKKNKPAFRRKIAEIMRNPKSLKKWNGFSYATWYSYRHDNTLKALRALDVPMLAIVGERDRVIDRKTTLIDLKNLRAKEPVIVYVLRNCGHHFTNHWTPVSLILSGFLARQK
jgi:pimeloyl-ACP methyl ester carboxylesterase